MALTNEVKQQLKEKYTQLIKALDTGMADPDIDQVIDTMFLSDNPEDSLEKLYESLKKSKEEGNGKELEAKPSAGSGVPVKLTKEQKEAMKENTYKSLTTEEKEVVDKMLSSISDEERQNNTTKTQIVNLLVSGPTTEALYGKDTQVKTSPEMYKEVDLDKILANVIPEDKDKAQSIKDRYSKGEAFTIKTKENHTSATGVELKTPTANKAESFNMTGLKEFLVDNTYGFVNSNPADPKATVLQVAQVVSTSIKTKGSEVKVVARIKNAATMLKAKKYKEVRSADRSASLRGKVATTESVRVYVVDNDNNIVKTAKGKDKQRKAFIPVIIENKPKVTVKPEYKELFKDLGAETLPVYNAADIAKYKDMLKGMLAVVKQAEIAESKEQADTSQI